MQPIPAVSDAGFADFVERVTSAEFAETLGERVGWDAADLRSRLVLGAAEAAQTVRMLAGVAVADGDRVIEIGAGLGLASAYLSSCGFDVVALEPAGIGFDEHASVARNVAELLGSSHDVLEFGAESLRPEDQGRFGLIFSNNVLEHVESPVMALRALSSVLADDGVMIHSCPNYAIPFEPHFGLPLVPFRPFSTARLLPGRIRSSDVWRSLNFVTAREVREAARELGLQVHFRPGTFAASLERLDTDPEFRRRHRAIGRVAGLLRRTGVLRMMRRLPATWSTPMDFMMVRDGSDAGRVARWAEQIL